MARDLPTGSIRNRMWMVDPLRACVSAGWIRPLEVGVRDRVPVRVVCGVPESLVDAGFQLLRDHVLETIRLGMDSIHVDAERLGEVELEQTVMTRYLDGDTLPVLGERDAAIGGVLHEPECRKLLHHRARRRRRHAKAARERSRRHARPVLAQDEDLAQVVLDRVAQRCGRHGPRVDDPSITTGVFAFLAAAKWTPFRGSRDRNSRERIPILRRLMPPVPSPSRRSTLLASCRVRIRVGHSPDPDDAFMYWALTTDL